MPLMPRELEGLKKLTFHEGSFTYAGKSYSYSEIEHVIFTALQTYYVHSWTRNQTTYRANLLLRLTDGKAPTNIVTAIVITPAASVGLNAPEGVPIMHNVERCTEAARWHH